MWKKALVKAGVEALLALISHEKSAKSRSQADLFDNICEREGTRKRVFLYQQRRFVKVEKAAFVNSGCEVDGANQLVEA